MSLLSALGDLTQSWNKLLAKQSGITITQLFPELSPYPLGLIHSTPSELTNLITVGVKDTLQDAQLSAPLPHCGVVIGSSRGMQGALEKLLKMPSEDAAEGLNQWLDILPHQGAVTAARQLKTHAPVLSPMAACATGIWAIARAVQLIQTGECEQVLTGAVETPITPLTLAGFAKMGALAKTGCYPFDIAREGLVLGEGVALLLLESKSSALARKAKIYGQLGGFGLTADGYHVSAPEMEGTSARLAIEQCLKRSGLKSKDVHYIHAHGTSTRLNDANEARLIQALFPPSVAVSSTKGATGHTLGASGAMGVIFSLMAVQQQVLPPCVGLKEAEFPLNLVTEAQPYPVKNALCFSFGFGGQNAVIAVR